MVCSADGTTSGTLQAGHLLDRPANSALTLNLVAHLVQANVIFSGAAGATVADAIGSGATVSSAAGTTSDFLHDEQVVARPANSGLSEKCLPHWGQVKAIITFTHKRTDFPP